MIVFEAAGERLDWAGDEPSAAFELLGDLIE
jgi:hypothetical protein